MSTTIQHILVAHDFGETSQAALTYAIDLAAKLGARVTVVHAYEVPVYGFPEALALTADVLGRIQAAGGEALDGAIDRAFRSTRCCVRARPGARSGQQRWKRTRISSSSVLRVGAASPMRCSAAWPKKSFARRPAPC